jgi:hypothetical protein
MSAMGEKFVMLEQNLGPRPRPYHRRSQSPALWHPRGPGTGAAFG